MKFPRVLFVVPVLHLAPSISIPTASALTFQVVPFQPCEVTASNHDGITQID